MTTLVWLASYPKSGNTWFRMMLAGLHSGGPVDINELSARGGHASARDVFEDLTQLDSGLLHHDELEALLPDVHAAVKRGANPVSEILPGISFVKIHDAYRYAADGRPLFDAADKAIVIVRDPRDVAVALAQTWNMTIDDTIDEMGNANGALCADTSEQLTQFRQVMRDWSGHLASWIGQTDIPIHLVRYEDMKMDAGGVLAGALAFAGHPIDGATAGLAARHADFEKAQAQEREKGFREHVARHPSHLFFRNGEAGGWRAALTEGQIARLEAGHGAMMRGMGYSLCGGFREETSPLAAQSRDPQSCRG